MRHLTIDVSNYDSRLHIGKQGENLTREITFDCAAWLDDLSGGVLSIVHQRPTDPDAYPCGDYVTTDTSLTWSINETDVAFSGLGKCELRYTIGSRIAKTKTFYTEIVNALNPLDTPPEAYEPYIDRVIDAARWEMDALSVGGSASETERLSVQVDKIVPVDPDDGYGISFRFGIPKGADGKGVSNATASVDNNTGTPSVTVTTTDTEEGMDIDFSFHNLKGATGAAGQDGDSVGTVTASVDNNTGTPSVTVTTSGGSGSPVGIDLAFHNLKGQSFDTSFLPSDTESGSVASFPDGAKNVAVDELVTTIVPQQAGSGTPSPSNPRAISGRTEIKLSHLGKNLAVCVDSLNANNGLTATKNDDGSIQMTGTINRTYAVLSDAKYTKLPAGQYTFSIANALPFNLYIATKISGTSSTRIITAGNTSVTFTASGIIDEVYFGLSGAVNGTTFNEKIYAQLEKGSSASSFEAVIATDTIALGQTVYGGSLNVTTGVLTIDKAFISDLSQFTWTLHDSNNIFQSGDVPDIYVPQAASERNQFFVCSSYAPSVYTSINSTMTDGGMLSYQGRVYVRNTNYSDATAFKNSMSGVQLAYRIATPTIVQLTPTEVDTVLGSNTIYSDCGEVSVKYRADIGLYIDKKLS